MVYTKVPCDSNIIIHIPHASANILPIDSSCFMINDEELEKEKLVMVDWYVDELCEKIEANKLISNVCRLVVDMERFLDDALEPMAAHGMGVVYTTSHNGQIMKAIDKLYKEKLILEYYLPYHQELKNMCKSVIDEHGKCLLLDMHSFPSTPIFCYDYYDELPDVCIGYNKDDDKQVAKFIAELFTNKGKQVKFNYPFSGSILPNGLGAGYDKRIHSVMIEINRNLYMNEETSAKNENFFELQRELHSVVEGLNF